MRKVLEGEGTRSFAGQVTSTAINDMAGAIVKKERGGKNELSSTLLAYDGPELCKFSLHFCCWGELNIHILLYCVTRAERKRDMDSDGWNADLLLKVFDHKKVYYIQSTTGETQNYLITSALRL